MFTADSLVYLELSDGLWLFPKGSIVRILLSNSHTDDRVAIIIKLGQLCVAGWGSNQQYDVC